MALCVLAVVAVGGIALGATSTVGVGVAGR